MTRTQSIRQSGFLAEKVIDFRWYGFKPTTRCQQWKMLQKKYPLVFKNKPERFMFQKCRAMISLAPLGEPFQRIYFRTMEELLAVGSIECEMKPISKEQVKRLYRGQLALVQIGANHHRSFPHLVTIPVSNFAKSLY